MAAPMDRKPVEGKTTKLPPEIDLTSPRFDATKALFSRQILLPFASAQPLDNLAKFESWSKQSKKNEDISKNLQIEPARKQIQRPIPAVSLRRKTEQQSTSADLSKQSGRHRNKLNRNVLTRMD
ncbi:uncharacterized protein LOC117320447, partial [Pecten maximus]|uniref:uncharacterized protein LOC117320447 n=1 Tax=Pecten maximus TaxID=6579 RepID=UPI0014587F31